MAKKLKLKYYWIFALIIIIASGAIYYFAIKEPASKPNPTPNISSYTDCVNAGFPTTSNGKRYCTTADGSIYYDEDYKPVKTEYISEKGVKIFVTQPLNNDSISSPLLVKGRVPGNWSFEASFPISIVDAGGNTLSQTPAQLKGDWMTTDYVDFEATLTFEKQQVGTAGTLLLKKDNPSGLDENNDSVSVEVKF